MIRASLGRLTRPSSPPPFRLTDRDIAILKAVARFRVLSLPLVQRLIGASEQGLRDRLKLLFWHEALIA